MCEVRITKLRTGYRVRKKVSTNATVLVRYSRLSIGTTAREKSVEKKKALAL